METRSIPTDAEFIAGLKARDNEVISRFVKEYQDKMFRLCMQYLRNEDDALDMIQEVFATVIEKIEGFRGDSKLSTWIYSITVFTCIGYLRKKKRKKETSYDASTNDEDNDREYFLAKLMEKELSKNSPQEDGLLQKEAGQLLMKEIGKLPEHYKNVFILKELEGMSVKEVQKVIPIGQSAIKTRLHRARLHLRDRLVDYFDEMTPRLGAA